MSFAADVATLDRALQLARTPSQLVREGAMLHGAERHSAYYLGPPVVGLIICAHVVEKAAKSDVTMAKLATHLWAHFLWARLRECMN